MDIRNMNKYFIYVFSPLFYLSVALSGSLFTSTGEWYKNLIKPSYTPPGSVIGTVWTVIYILTAISLIIFINNAKNTKRFRLVISLYIVNGIVNAAWSYIFFTKHLLGPAVIDAGLIWITLLFMILFVWSVSRPAGILLVPYIGWVSFATYLTYVIYRMN